MRAIGLDFGTTNSAVAVVDDRGQTQLASYSSLEGSTETFRSILYFDEERRLRNQRLDPLAGPQAIDAYLDGDGSGRLIQSTKSYLASRIFQSTRVFGQSFDLSDLIASIVGNLRIQAESQLGALKGPVVAGRPVEFARADGASDERYAVARLKAALAKGGFKDVILEYEPVAAAYHYEAKLDHDECILIADFGGGTSDFCLINVGPGRRRQGGGILGTEGVGVAGDAFDAKLVRNVVAPEMGKGSMYRSMAKDTPMPAWYFSRLERWHHLSFLRSKKTLRDLEEIHAGSHEADRVSRLLHVIEYDLGFQLYRSVERCKRQLSDAEEAIFRFEEPEFTIESVVKRSDFEGWISDELQAIEQSVERLLAQTGVVPGDVDRVFMTGGTSFVPAVREIFSRRFGADKLDSGGELTSVANGLALRALDEMS